MTMLRLAGRVVAARPCLCTGTAPCLCKWPRIGRNQPLLCPDDEQGSLSALTTRNASQGLQWPYLPSFSNSASKSALKIRVSSIRDSEAVDRATPARLSFSFKFSSAIFARGAILKLAFCLSSISARLR